MSHASTALAPAPAPACTEDPFATMARLMHGFTPAPAPATLTRSIGGCIQSVTLVADPDGGAPEYRIALALPAHELLLHCDSRLFDDAPSGVLAGGAHIASTPLLPFLNGCHDIAGIDRLLNERSAPFEGALGWQGIHFVALYAARMNANPRFEELVTGHLQYLRTWDSPGAVLLGLQAWADALRSGAVKSCRGIDSMLAQCPARLRAYIEGYDSAKARPIRMAASGGAGVAFVDANLGFRRIVAHAVQAAPASAPIALVRDLFLAEAQYASAGNSVHPCVAPLVHTLLVQGDAASLDAFEAGLEYGEHVVAAMKTITLPFMIVSERADECRRRAALAASAGTRRLLEDFALFLEDSLMLQDAPMTVEAFIASYTLAASYRIAYKFNCVAPLAGRANKAKDLNAEFRAQVLLLVLQAPDAAPLHLVCDLFLAEHEFQRHQHLLAHGPSDGGHALLVLAQNMLARGSLRELDLFVMSLAYGTALRPPLNGLVLPDVMARAYAGICEQRSRDFACPERSYRYRNFALYFATLRNEDVPAQPQRPGAPLLSLYQA